AGGLTTPGNLALIGGTGGLGEAEGTANAVFSRLLSAGFGAQSLYSAYREVPALRKAMDAGDYSEAERIATHVVLNTGLGVLAAKHAATGKAAITGRSDTETPLSETNPIASGSAVGEALRNPTSAPDIRLTDSSSTKQHLENRDTVAPETNSANPT